MKTENFEARSTDPVTEQSKGEEKSQSYKALKIRGIVQDAERKLKTKRRKNKTKAEKRKTLTTLLVNKLMATSVAHSQHRHHSNNRPKETQTVERILKKKSSTSTALPPHSFYYLLQQATLKQTPAG
jgi:peptide methionine sulfoxide reductase MsrA